MFDTTFYGSGVNADNFFSFILLTLLDLVLTPIYMVGALLGFSFGNPLSENAAFGGAIDLADHI